MKYTVEPQDQEDHEIGLEIIRVLQLRRKRSNGRVKTTHGDKNPCGLARTLRHLSAGPMEKAAPDLLVALRDLLESFGAYIDIDSVTNADIADPVTKARAAIAKAIQA